MAHPLDSWYRRCRLLLISVVTLTVVWTATDRFAAPTVDRYVDGMFPGNADAFIPWAAARAWIEGRNPYLSPLYDPWGRREIVDNQVFYLLYPPAIVTLYLPLAYYTNNYMIATAFMMATVVIRKWHFFCLLAMAMSAWLTIRLVRRSLGHEHTDPLLFLVLFVIITMCPQTGLALERGQSDITVAFFCWVALILFLYKHVFWAVFLASAATLVKGYPLVFGAGLGLLALERKSWIRAISGAVSAAVVFLYPMREYLDVGLIAATHRTAMACFEWRNYGFSQFVYQAWPHSPIAATWGRPGIATLCFLCSMLCVVHAHRASLLGRVRWIAFFSVFSLITMVGYSPCGYMYSFIIIAPGILIVLACAPELLASIGLGRVPALIGAALQVWPAYLMFAVKADEPTHSGTANGLALFIFLNGGLLLIGALRRRVHIIPNDAV